MEFVEYNIYDGNTNMKIDEDLLKNSVSIKKNGIFRLYGWKPACVSLGRNQDETFLNLENLKKYNIDVTRRLTGGRALLHDKELTYSCVIPVSSIQGGENVSVSYKAISGILIKAFEKLGIDLSIGGLARHITKNNYCMAISTGADLCWKDRKFIGSAQCRKNGYILQHGSILLDYNRELLDNIFEEKTDFSTIVCLKEINPSLKIEDVINSIKETVLEDEVL
jgi:lipoate-protein ligase A